MAILMSIQSDSSKSNHILSRRLSAFRPNLQSTVAIWVIAILLLPIISSFTGIHLENNNSVFQNAYGSSDSKGKEKSGVVGSIFINQGAIAKLNKASGTFTEGEHTLGLELIAEYLFDTKSNRLKINDELSLAHLVIDGIAGMHYIQLSNLEVSSDYKSIAYKGNLITNDNDPQITTASIELSGIITLKQSILFDQEVTVDDIVVGKSLIHVKITEQIEEKPGEEKTIVTTTLISGKSGLHGNASTNIFPGPSEIEGKSFTIKTLANNEEFEIFATDPEAIKLLMDNYNDENSFFVIGKLNIGGGGFNSPWSWHLDPDYTGMAEFSIELCDGVPSEIENNLAYWLFQVKIFCPWSSKVISING